MNIDVDIFWSFRSSYSYLALSRIVELHKKYNFNVFLRVVLPLAIRDPDYFNNLPKSRKNYGFIDVHRIAEYHGIPFGWPNPDPVSFKDGKADKEQPLITWISRLGVLAELENRGLDFVKIISPLIWSGNIKNWDKGKYISNALDDGGFKLKEMNIILNKNLEKIDMEIKKNSSLLEKSGHWGVPTLVINGEPFFGQDRLELFEWRLKKVLCLS